jgi:uncharacterized membrane protein
MPQPKMLAILLFGSLGLNLFLGGALGSHWMSNKKSADALRKAPSRMERPRIPPHPAARPRGPEGMSASADLALLRQMVGIMGGPSDPRLKQLLEKRKGEISEMRREVHAAHERVRMALSAEDANDKELADALKNLRKTTFEAQARAQEGILLLASLMTPEERKLLREARLPGRADEGRQRKGVP